MNLNNAANILEMKSNKHTQAYTFKNRSHTRVCVCVSLCTTVILNTAQNG